MKRYILITNIWGRQADKYQGWNYKKPESNPIVCDQERTEFDTIEEARTHIELFEEYCSTFDKAVRKAHYGWDCVRDRNKIFWKYNDQFEFNTPTARTWGWILGDRETLNWVWGGNKLRQYDNKTDKRFLKDMLFRGPDEIPEDYKWDDGEYEGWLQFRWGDGKNAVGYVDKKTGKPAPAPVVEDDFERGEYEDFGEDIENKFSKMGENERKKILAERW